MKKTLFWGFFFTVLLQTGAFPQNQNTPHLEKLLKEALVIKIQARLYHDVQNLMWQSEVEKLTIPGRQVTIKMQNKQARLSVHFTPYRNLEEGMILVAQSEIWLLESAPGDQSENLQHFTSMKSIPVDYDEFVYFYPLGKLENLENPDQIHVEMSLCISPYNLIDDTLTADDSPAPGDR